MVAPGDGIMNAMGEQFGKSAGQWAVGLLVLWVGCLFLRTPIIGLDTDLWYHLSHGRHLWSTGEIPHSTDFSFFTPTREFIDYYWLFQGLVYGVFQGSGYFGLVVLRAVLFCAALAMVGAYLFHGRRESKLGMATLLVFGLCVLALYPRYQLLRPHTISYLCIPLFLYILEYRPRWIWVLPGIGLLWVNIHGVEYPVMVLIVGAYLGELVLGWWLAHRGDPDWQGVDRAGLRRAAVLVVTLGVVLLTPFGVDLVGVPFTSTSDASQYIVELSKPRLEDVLHVRVESGLMVHRTAFNLLGLLILLAAIQGLVRGRLGGNPVHRGGERRPIRWGHVVLLLGGAYLQSRALRFANEWILLALPWLRVWAVDQDRWIDSWLERRVVSRWRPVMSRALILGALAIPAVHLWADLPRRAGQYPMARLDLPHGVAAFLDHLDLDDARVMNHPNVGGFMLWSSNSTYKISTDMETPFVFTEEDFFLASNFYTDPQVQGALLERYDPEFIVVPIELGSFVDFIRAHPQYEPVYFDDSSVLYAHRGHYPDVVDRWSLGIVDPYTLKTQRFGGLDPAAVAEHLRVLDRMLELTPELDNANQVMAILLNRSGQFDKALGYARAAIDNSPSLMHAHLIRGDALLGLGRGDEALDSYLRGLRYASDDTERDMAHRALASAQARLGDEVRALKALRRAINPYRPDVSFVELYQLGTLELAAGDVERARRLLRFASWKVPADAVEWRRRIDEQLARFEGS